MTDQRLFLRKASLIVTKGAKGLDLSQFQFTFNTSQNDAESPSSAVIRVFNLSPANVTAIREEYSDVTVQAGYQQAGFGVIFQGSIRQTKIGREDGHTSYIDLLAADGDLAYNYAFVNKTIEAPANTPESRIDAAMDAMSVYGVGAGYTQLGTGGTIPNPRGKVVFGMARALLRQETVNVGCSWSIQNGQVQIIPLDSYLPGEAVQLNAQTGLVGTAEQTQEGIVVKCLLNPRIAPGTLIQINNADINRTLQQDPNSANVAYNQWSRIQALASVTADGLYRAYVVEHEGDTRGVPWYTNIIALAVAPDTLTVKLYG